MGGGGSSLIYYTDLRGILKHQLWLGSYSPGGSQCTMRYHHRSKYLYHRLSLYRSGNSTLPRTGCRTWTPLSSRSRRNKVSPWWKYKSTPLDTEYTLRLLHETSSRSRKDSYVPYCSSCPSRSLCTHHFPLQSSSPHGKQCRQLTFLKRMIQLHT
jgi:hypothetical protein